MNRMQRMIMTFCCWLGLTIGYAQNDRFIETCKQKAEGNGMAVNGVDQWAFLKSELRHLSVGEFWGEKAQQTACAVNKEQRDPLKAIVNYNKLLKDEGIELLLVPIPPKAIIYPDKLDKALSVKRYDTCLQQFYQLLEQQGVWLLDLSEQLIQARKEVGEPLYCLGDSHLSGEGCRVVAEAIATHIKIEGKKEYVIKDRKVTFKGDLYTALPSAPRSEERTIYVVSGDQTKNNNSEVVLMGDSHTLVFDIGGDLFADNAGIASLLAGYLKLPVDVIGVRGSGATSARVNFYRRSKQDKDFLKRKKIVVWCFAAREFTEATSWNATVPIK